MDGQNVHTLSLQDVTVWVSNGAGQGRVGEFTSPKSTRKMRERVKTTGPGPSPEHQNWPIACPDGLNLKQPPSSMLPCRPLSWMSSKIVRFGVCSPVQA